jgi:hypothetical protein
MDNLEEECLAYYIGFGMVKVVITLEKYKYLLDTC